MAFVTLPGGIRVAVEFDLQGKIVVNIYHITTTDPIITVKLIAIAQLFADWWEVDLASTFSFQIDNVAVSALDMSIINGEKIELPTVPPMPGGFGDRSIPNNCAVVASLLTAKTGRSFQGRSYHAGMEVESVQGNTVVTTRAAEIVAAYLDLDVRLLAAASTLVVASFVSEGEPRVTGVATPVSAVAVRNRVDTQRRRLPRE